MGDNQSMGSSASPLAGLLGQMRPSGGAPMGPSDPRMPYRDPVRGGMVPQPPPVDTRRQQNHSNYGMYRDATGQWQQDSRNPPPGSIGGPPAGGQGFQQPPQMAGPPADGAIDKAGSQGSSSSQQLNAIKQMAGGGGMNPGVSQTPVLPTAQSRPATVRPRTPRDPFAPKPFKGFGIK